MRRRKRVEKIIRWRTLLIVAALVITLGLIGMSQGIAQQKDSGNGKGSSEKTDENGTEPQPESTTAEPSIAATVAPDPTTEVSFAVVNSNGTLARDLGAVSAQKLGTTTGQYEVIFDHDVSKCAFVATIGLSDNVGSPPAGEISVNGRNGNPAGVYVATYNSSGARSDRGFHLQVACPPPVT